MKKAERNKMTALMSDKGVNTVLKKLCGELLGKGCYRDVYVFKQFPDYVIKIERDMSDGNFANVTEWRNYIQHKDWNLLIGWLAACELINETGSVLIQERVFWDGRKRKDYPKYIPSVFTDMKVKNYGWNKHNQFVCCDYSFMRLGTGKRKNELFRYAKWWGTLK